MSVMGSPAYGRLQTGSWIEELTARVSRYGYAVIRGRSGARQTIGLEPSYQHPELLLDAMEPDHAKAMVRHVAMGVKYQPGLYKILGRDVRITSLTVEAIKREMPVAWTLLNTDLRALRVRYENPSAQ